MATPVAIGPLLTDVSTDAMDEGDFIACAVVLMKTCKADGSTGFLIANSEGMDWITQRGLVDAARWALDNDG